MQETRVWSLGQDDTLEKGMATHSSIHAWRIPWTEEPGGLQSIGSQRVPHDWVTNTFTFAQSITFQYPLFNNYKGIILKKTKLLGNPAFLYESPIVPF